jgi:hypothetical protein
LKSLDEGEPEDALVEVDGVLHVPGDEGDVVESAEVELV